MNNPIRNLFGFFVALFALLVAFTSNWTVFDAQSLVDNRANRRQLLEQERIRRGNITIADGTVVARSVSCLLYTSPSPRDRTRSRMPSSA